MRPGPLFNLARRAYSISILLFKPFSEGEFEVMHDRDTKAFMSRKQKQIVMMYIIKCRSSSSTATSISIEGVVIVVVVIALNTTGCGRCLGF